VLSITLVVACINDCQFVDCPQDYPVISVGIVDQDSITIAGQDTTYIYQIDSMRLFYVAGDSSQIEVFRTVRNTGRMAPSAANLNAFDLNRVEAVPSVSTFYLQLNASEIDTIDIQWTTYGDEDMCCEPSNRLLSYTINQGPSIIPPNADHIEIVK